MNPQEMKTIKHAAGHIESALKAFEDILADTNNQLLYKSTGSLVQVLRYLHELDAGLLSAENRERIEDLLKKDKPKGGRDSFTTGF
ncbi:MAG: hypothetical protein JWO30_2043 [Fibrobacteres bacterium]|nr:hypothetical protein [Fibrobacterota bacterium]